MTTTAITTNCGTALDMIAALRVLAMIKMPPLGAFAVNKALAILTSDPDVKAADGVRSAALEKYGADNGSGQYVLPPEKAKLYLLEYREIAFQPVTLDLPGLPAVVMERLAQSSMELTPALLASLEPLWEAL